MRYSISIAHGERNVNVQHETEAASIEAAIRQTVDATDALTKLPPEGNDDWAAAEGEAGLKEFFKKHGYELHYEVIPASEAEPAGQ